MSKRFYVTTAIDYVNGEPHLGHAYEKVVTDVMARAHQSLGKEVFYLTGLDEHGQKVQQAAEAAGMSPQAYCDKLATSWIALTKKLGLANNDFIRTSSDRHKEVVSRILTKLYDTDHFYKDSYQGYYSTKEETFLTEKDKRPDGTFDPMYGEVTELVEENYYFKLGRHQQWLIDHIEANPDFVSPDYRRNEVLGFLKNNTLEDLCISRPKARLEWGIPLPFDPEFVTYVWFDALVNYASLPAALGDPGLASLRDPATSADGNLALWPADAHVIGKDILKFHAVYWPIMLKAMEVPLPKQICVHGWWQKNGEKMSKSTGNVVDPIAVIDDWGLDAFRYYVVRELDIGPDGNWTDQGFEARYSAELANGLGNLVNRSLSMLNRYRDGKVPAASEELATDANNTINSVKEQLEQHRLQAALQNIWTYIARVNQYIDQTAPFKLAKQPDQAGRLDEILYNMVESVRLLAILIWPTLPTTAERIFSQLNLEGSPSSMQDAEWGRLAPGHQVGKPEPLFPRRDLKK
jgi:methionyl-tRNA synthetase